MGLPFDRCWNVGRLNSSARVGAEARIADRANLRCALLGALLGGLLLGDLLFGGVARGGESNSAAVAGGEAPTFERHVRPILKAHCFHCHGEGDELAGGLDLRLARFAVKGGDSGAAVAPGDVAGSSLVQRIRDGEMPPAEAAHRPSAAEIAVLERWIAGGARTLRPEPESLDPFEYFTEEERSYWAFQPVVRPSLPEVRQLDQVRTPVDRFLLARLEQQELGFNAPADKAVLLRRACYVLWGLPPTPELADEFLHDDRPDAWQRLIDKLLASPQYGERWGRHWLDVAGYADSEGYDDEDTLRPHAWRYRDYVIRAFNDDKPLDRFIIEQLAGDELVSPPYEELPPEGIDCLVATGFLRMAPDGTATAGANAVTARNDVVAGTIEVVSSSLLGLTVACAQCHNHRYDPISHVDYHRLRAIFEPAYDPKAWKVPGARRISLYTQANREEAARIEAEAKQVEAERLEKLQAHIDRVFELELAKLPEDIREPIREARATAADKQTPEQKKLLREHPSVNVSAGSLYLYDGAAAKELKELADRAVEIRKQKPAEEFVRALTEPLGKAPPATLLFHRGDPEQPRNEVLPGELSVLAAAGAPAIEPDDTQLPTTGRRLAYARWLVSGKHPLTGRVLANRIWLQVFGRGLVATPGDFGRLGTPPTHPDLLDWLADELVQSGWSVKHMQRLLLNSAAFRASSQRRPELDQRDPDDLLYARMPVRRLDAEGLRDSVLAASGSLNTSAFGPPIPVMADEVGQFVIGIENLNAGRPGEVIDMQGEQYRRSIYVQVRRSRPLAVLDTFDLPAMAPNCTSRTASTGATQSLLMMNSEFLLEQSRQMARSVIEEVGTSSRAQVLAAWRRLFANEPAESEVQPALELLATLEAHYEAHPPTTAKPNGKATQASGADATADERPLVSPAAEEALIGLCHALLSSNRFMYVE